MNNEITKVTFYLIQVVVIILGFYNTVAFSGEIYKWVDEDGRVHYGDKPTQRVTNKVTINKAPEFTNEMERKLAIQRQQLHNTTYTDKRNGKMSKAAAREIDKQIQGTWGSITDNLSGKK